MPIFVNRILNLRKIRVIGLDMDHTLIRYHSENFEAMTHFVILNKLISKFHYPEKIRNLKFQWNLVIRGLAIDRPRGNLLKMSRHGKVKQASHGTKLLTYPEVKQIYGGLVIDLNDPQYEALDTAFSVAQVGLLAQIIDLAEHSPNDYPSFEQMALDVKNALDEAHRDGSLKEKVREDVGNFIIQDPKVVEALEKLKTHMKKLIVITNSDISYTKLLLDFAITPFLKNHRNWGELFDLVVTSACKPSFFTENKNFLEVDAQNNQVREIAKKIEFGKIYQGGSSQALQQDLELEGEDILYLGDHIYGDILALKKSCNWRTALVVEEIEHETLATERALHILNQIDDLMEKKEHVEDRIDLAIEKNDQMLREKLGHEIDQIDKRVQELLGQYRVFFNPYWGEIMRAGQEESRLMGQVEKYACIYMAKVADFLDYSPRKYFRPKRSPLPHEMKARTRS